MSYVEVFHRQRLERLQRFERAAKEPKIKNQPRNAYAIPNTPYGVPKIDPERKPAPIKDEWVERQKQVHKPIWFEITEGPKEFADPRDNKVHPRLETIRDLVAKHFGVRVHDMLGDRRTANLVLPRQVMFYLGRHLTLHSLPRIGAKLGRRDHTTVLHAVRKIAQLRTKDMHVDATVEYLIHQLGGEPA